MQIYTSVKICKSYCNSDIEMFKELAFVLLCSLFVRFNSIKTGTYGIIDLLLHCKIVKVPKIKLNIHTNLTVVVNLIVVVEIFPTIKRKYNYIGV